MEAKKTYAHIQTYLFSLRLALLGNKVAQPGQERVRSLSRGTSQSAYGSKVHHHTLLPSVLWPWRRASEHIVMIHRNLELIHMLLAKPSHAIRVHS